MLKILVVDDEKLARESLVYLLQEYCTESVRVIGSASSAAEAREVLQTHEVDALFLDISMPLETGFDLINSLPEGKYSVVFVTAYAKYALQAIKANAIDYLMKPVDIDELRQAVAKLDKISLYSQADRIVYEAAVQNTIADLKAQRKTVNRLTVPSGQGLSILEAADIVQMEADSNYTIFTMQNGKKLTISKTLKEFEDVLDDSVFVRIHKSHILNLAHLKTFSATHSTATTTLGDTLAVSRRRWTEFCEKVGDFAAK
jgi:two-component system, LytTR family, response regulator